MKAWDDWSDLEVNKSIAIAKGQKVIQQSMVIVGRIWVIEGWDGGIYKIPDYCNNPADMWPIILENNIVITPCMGANIGDATGYSEHQNPVISEFNYNSKALRAAAIVFLMMNGVNPE